MLLPVGPLFGKGGEGLSYLLASSLTIWSIAIDIPVKMLPPLGELTLIVSLDPFFSTWKILSVQPERLSIFNGVDQVYLVGTLAPVIRGISPIYIPFPKTQFIIRIQGNNDFDVVRDDYPPKVINCRRERGLSGDIRIIWVYIRYTKIVGVEIVAKL